MAAVTGATFGVLRLEPRERAWFGVCRSCGQVALRRRQEKKRPCSRVLVLHAPPDWKWRACKGEVRGIPGQQALRAAYALGGDEAVVEVLVERGVIERPQSRPFL